MKYKGWWKTFLRDQRGTATIYVALLMVALLGSAAMAVDVGDLVLAKRQISDWADSAALAGVQELPTNPLAAEETARNYFLTNQGETDGIDTEITADGKQLTVIVTRHVPFYFAKALGIDEGTVTARAVARTGTITGLWGVVPLAVQDQQFTYGSLYELKKGGGSGTSGNYGALALGGRGASNYEDNLANGYQGTIRVGDSLETEPGNMSGPTKRAVEERIAACHDGCTPDHYLPDCPRIIYLPIVDSFDLNGRDHVTVVGFAAFFLQGVQGNGNNSIVQGYFLRKLADGEIGDGAEDHGLWGVKLVE